MQWYFSLTKYISSLYTSSLWREKNHKISHDNFDIPDMYLQLLHSPKTVVVAYMNYSEVREEISTVCH